MSIWPIIPIALGVTVITIVTSASGEIIPRLVFKVAQNVTQLFDKSLKRNTKLWRKP